MIRYVSLLLLSSFCLFALGCWTLTGVSKANIHVTNKITYLKEETILQAKEKMITMLQKEGIKLNLTDSPILQLELQEMESDDDFYVYIKLSLGEEVQTFRDDKSITFALTYQITDFIEVDSEYLDSEVLESLDSLLSEFSKQFKDDKE